MPESPITHSENRCKKPTTRRKNTKTRGSASKPKTSKAAATKGKREAASAAASADGEIPQELKQGSVPQSKAAPATRPSRADSSRKRSPTVETEPAKKAQGRAEAEPKSAPPQAEVAKPADVEPKPDRRKAKLPPSETETGTRTPAESAAQVSPDRSLDKAIKPPGPATNSRKVAKSTPARRKRTRPTPPTESPAPQASRAQKGPPEASAPERRPPPKGVRERSSINAKAEPQLQSIVTAATVPTASAAISMVAEARREVATTEVAVPAAPAAWPSMDPAVRGFITMLALDIGVLAVLARSGSLLTSPVGITVVLLFSLLLIGQAALTRGQRSVSNLLIVLAVVPFYVPSTGRFLVDLARPWDVLPAHCDQPAAAGLHAVRR